MNLDKYPVISTNEHLIYEFLSEGPNGTIKKVVVFDQLQPDLYNLAFGDWDETTQQLIDDARSNNADRDKVLTTVAHAVVDFMQHRPNARLYAEGVTKAKTRLYQIGINANWEEISQLFDIKGFVNNPWEPFQRNKNYEAFVLAAK